MVKKLTIEMALTMILLDADKFGIGVKLIEFAV